MSSVTQLGVWLELKPRLEIPMRTHWCLHPSSRQYPLCSSPWILGLGRGGRGGIPGLCVAVSPAPPPPCRQPLLVTLGSGGKQGASHLLPREATARADVLIHSSVRRRLGAPSQGRAWGRGRVLSPSGTLQSVSKTNAEARACYFTHSFVTLQANSFLTWEVVGS